MGCGDFTAFADYRTGTAPHSDIAQPTATVVVGDEGKLVFSPSYLNASIGTTISFNFLALNHTLTQSRFQDPCVSNGGFDSGFHQFNPSNISGKFVVEYKVTSDNPQWFFCAQIAPRAHCKAGMVFSLNPRGLQSQFLFQAMAKTTSATPSHEQSSGLPTLSTVPIVSVAPPMANRTVPLPTDVRPTASLPVFSSIGNSVVASRAMMWSLSIVIAML
ncbi:hypothetical protein J3E72DRAFT_280045 [Bipolaris maydis]|uniref:uncharacterized protein n=1 Tax=Cochliobolus heterostrophus TaxID=5016 RepID=UPI0024D11585|nr:hypothetical protein J3E73DRAFT_348657 [Bipolaris maydis]KAJ6202939.1 hypothetical protein J3E72DRAFT_280045 [Bipolaris maydis]KAJ6275474.1 hypothetical protein PSV08DRAFT_253879 [Bipolaris maydis]